MLYYSNLRFQQEQRASQGATVSGPGDTITVGGQEGKPRMRRKKHRPQRKNLAQVEGLDDHPVRTGRLVVAAHYDGDTSNYKMGHTHYQGKCRGPGSVAQEHVKCHQSCYYL